ncbi:MAG: DUF5752 family protein [Acidobacteriota bacterium]
MDAFAVKDCVLIAIATGERAQTLRELRDRLHDAHSGCVYYHFWGGLLYTRFDDPEFQNDFSSWAYRALGDLPLAERLGIIDPTAYTDMEELRREVIDVIEERLEESELIAVKRAEAEFHFIRSNIIVLDSGIRAQSPEEMGRFIDRLPVSSIFYHFIDARRRLPHMDRARNDFSLWLETLGGKYTALADDLSTIDPYFVSLTELRTRIAAAFKEHLA